MPDFVLYFAIAMSLIGLGYGLFLVISGIYFRIFYRDSKGWRKCHNCKSLESEMYNTPTWYGTKWECSKCAKL